jgi:hypothetical protein
MHCLQPPVPLYHKWQIQIPARAQTDHFKWRSQPGVTETAGRGRSCADWSIDMQLLLCSARSCSAGVRAQECQEARVDFHKKSLRALSVDQYFRMFRSVHTVRPPKASLKLNSDAYQLLQAFFNSAVKAITVGNFSEYEPSVGSR